MTKRITPLETIRQRFTKTDHVFAETDAVTLDPCHVTNGDSDVSIPQEITSLINNRQSARDAVFGVIAQPGQIIRISPTSNISETATTGYLAVLLDAEMSAGNWRGWLVGRDTEYACDWDLILGPEDDPRDPACQVVQIWNPVSLAIEAAACVLAEIPRDRLIAARSLAKDFEQLRIPTLIDDHRMGVHLARELSDGTGVVTGTSVASSTDPRHEYQQLYRDAAYSLSQRARALTVTSTIRPTNPRVSIRNWLETIFGYPGQLRLFPAALAFTLLIVPFVAFMVMRYDHARDATDHYVSGDAFQQIYVTNPDKTSRELEAALRAVGVEPEIRYEGGGTIVIEANLKPLALEHRQRIAATYGIAVPADQKFRVVIFPTMPSAPPR
jgi:hypothetical protein